MIGGTIAASSAAEVVVTPSPRGISREHRKIIFAATTGTIFEWYDFFLFGSLAGVIAKSFFSDLDPTAGYIFALLAFAAGFIVRPIGAVIFGRLGDTVGRKYTFLATILIMGSATFLVGLIPTYPQAGIVAPVCLITLRLLQGLAIGGEYGGAAVYVAEHALPGKRGLYTSWIQTTATLGLVLSLLVIFGVRLSLGEDMFQRFGWRIPFLASAVLLMVSAWSRLRLSESPVFQQLKAEGRTSGAPVIEAFSNRGNAAAVFLAFVLCAGAAVVGYVGQLYSFFFLTTSAKVDPTVATLLLAVALTIGTPLFVIFGALSDYVGRKVLIVSGFALSAAISFAIFPALLTMSNIDLARAQAAIDVTIATDAATCTFQANPIARETDYRSPCDIAKRALSQMFIPYKTVSAATGAPTTITLGDTVLVAPSAELDPTRDFFTAPAASAVARFRAELAHAATLANLTHPASASLLNHAAVILLLVVLQIPMAMAYGPLAATLVDLFPSRVRYTSLSLPYHLGNGWIGGLLPSVAFALVAATGDIYAGLWYPVTIAIAAAFVCYAFLTESVHGRPAA